MNDLLVVIPAIKKNAVIPDQLIKKLDGITLIQRAINTAKELSENIFIITDSEEIFLISERNNIECYYDFKLQFYADTILLIILNILKDKNFKNILLYRANTPLVNKNILKEAYIEFLKDDKYILTSVKELDEQLLKYKGGVLSKVQEKYFKELKSFYFFTKNSHSFEFKPFVIEQEKSIEIESYQDWWICEKILQRKRIVFNVIGSTKLGMGHIYHSLALAHEILNHEVLFICDAKYEIAVEKIASMDYKVISTREVTKKILELKPDLVINDILDTNIEYIETLKNNNIKVVNFEDLGSGTRKADLVINELYDEPKIQGNNFLWGYEYVALRDEFENAEPHTFKSSVNSVLITFGGTDQNNLTLLILNSIIDIAEENSVQIYIVCGGGYLFKKELEEYLFNQNYKNIELTFAVGVISKIMEKTSIAFSSNGRTVYELADMNIPSIILSHHQRESNHTFTTLEKGFINLGIYNQVDIDNLIQSTFKKLVLDNDYRKLLFLNIQKYKFRKNKQKVVKKILELI